MNNLPKITTSPQPLSPATATSEPMSFHTAQADDLYQDNVTTADDAAALASSSNASSTREAEAKFSMVEMRFAITSGIPVLLHINHALRPTKTITLPLHVPQSHMKQHFAIGTRITGDLYRYTVDPANEPALIAFLHWIKCGQFPVLGFEPKKRLAHLMECWKFGYRIQARGFVNVVMETIFALDDKSWDIACFPPGLKVNHELGDVVAYKAWFCIVTGRYAATSHLLNGVPTERFHRACIYLCYHYRHNEQDEPSSGSLKDHMEMFMMEDCDWID